MDSKNEGRTGKDRRQNDSFHTFNIPSGRRWLDRRRPTIKTGRGMSSSPSESSKGI